MLVRAILTEYAKEANPSLSRVVEDDLTFEQMDSLNTQGYNIYFLPNYPSIWQPGVNVDGAQIDRFEWVFLDMDLKDGVYSSKGEFINHVNTTAKIPPTSMVDSGNGIHCYWQISDLDATSFLRLQRRLCRLYKTDPAVCTIYQLMRVPGTMNVKRQDNIIKCDYIHFSDNLYTAEQIDRWLPKITPQDEVYCEQHYNRTYQIQQDVKIDVKIPHKFLALLNSSREVKELFSGDVSDRSRADYRLAHIMQAEGFTKSEAMSVLVNCSKALSRTEVHRNNYAFNIVDKVWIFESSTDKDNVPLSSSVRDILRRGVSTKGRRLNCWEVFDGTEHGFRTGHVLGLIGGAGSGKTTLTLNYMYWFAKLNPDSIHLFFSGEQTEEEIAATWVQLCRGNDDSLLDKLQILGNYNSDGSFRNLSLSEIESYAIELEKRMNTKIGCLGIDHIGILKKQGKDGEAQGIMDICHQMKAVATRTDTFLIMQSQSTREKAGIGDIELNKDAAYGTSLFEWYCDWVVTSWQPLKRIYAEKPDMTCNAYKYAKIRHKNVLKDRIKEDSVQILMFDPNTKRLNVMTEMQDKAFDYWNDLAIKAINKDRKKDPTKRTKIDWVGKKL